MTNNQTTSHFIGELRRHKDRNSMCVMINAEFGGGEGDVWVTEDYIYDFALEREHTFYRGICRGLNSSDKTLKFEIYEGPTWGEMAMGGIFTIKAADLTHIRSAKYWHGSTLIPDSKKMISKERANRAFERTSLEELKQAYRYQFEGEIEAMLGKANFEFTKELLTTYVDLCRSYNPAGANGHRMPSPNESKAKRKMLRLLKEGIRHDD